MTPATSPHVSAARLDSIIRTVAAASGVSVSEILSQRRNARSVRARHLAMWLCRQTTDASYPQIAQAFGERDHSTIMHGVARTVALIPQDAVLAHLARSLAATFGAPRDV